MKLGKAELAQLMAFLGQADQYLDAGEEIVKGAKPTVVRALKLLLNTGLDVADDLDKELNRLSAWLAKDKRRIYQNYVEVGFTPEQAFSLVLASVKSENFTEVLKKSNVLSREKNGSKPAK